MSMLNNNDTRPSNAPLTIHLDAPVSTLNGQESWQELKLREPVFAEMSDFYREQLQTNQHDAMASLIAAISGVNLMAVKKLPVLKFRDAQAYLLGFLNYFPTKTTGGK